ncbi:MAG: carboxypeptidase regulatory-like domain-containing protein [Acidobacteriota bacterium]|nr:carboxypeptidase regulatory-like domain-containing protein [Acidobacteriota bacterium]
MSTSIVAQVAGGTITGTIMDSSGSVVAKARIDITNRATGTTRTVTTNEDGIFSAPNLVPGDYQVTASTAGFAPKRSNLTLTVGDVIDLPLSLSVGAIDQKVEVVDAPPSIELSSSAMGAVVTGQTVRDLPLNGRSWTDLSTLQPGVAGVSTQVAFDQGAGRGNRGFGAQISISGGRPSQNNYRLDGISINDYANSGPGSVIGTNLGVDAIGQFSVLTSNYSAEYGKTSGGVINAITRSGSNQLHGSAYSFFRNSALDARNYFDTGSTPPPFSRYQYGGSAGGRIWRDRTFFFGDFEAIRQNLSTTASANVLSNAGRAKVTDPAVLKYIGLFPIANQNTTTTGDIAQYSFVNQEIATENFFTTRIDHNISVKDSVFGTYLFDNTPFTIGDAQFLTLDSSKTRRQDLILEENHIFNSSFLNSIRFGLNRQNVSNNIGVQALNPLASDTTLAVIAGRTAPGVNVPGLTRVVGGVGSSPSYLFRFTTFQGYDDAFLTRGKHTLTFGVAFERLQNNIKALSNPNGLFNFGSTSALIANTPSKFQAGIASTLSPRNLRQFFIGAYIQDNWHFRPSLTLNLGVRYEMSNVPTEVAGKLSVLQNITDPAPHLGSPYFNNPTLKNFEPRVGFVYDPFANHRTSIRGGYGLYDVLPLLYQFEILSVLSAPYFEIGATSDPAVKLGASPAYVQNALVAKASALGQAYIQQNPKRNYVSQWNFSIQRELARNVSLSVGYAGSRGLHLPYRVEDANQVLPTKTAQGYLWPSTPGTPINPNAGTIRALWWMAKSSYNALETDLTANTKFGLTAKGAFTWGKSLDNNSATIAGDSFGNSVPSLDWYDTTLSYGRSDFDVGKIFVLSAVYAVPDQKDLRGFVGAARNGWQIGGIYKQSAGTPFTPLIGGDPLGKGGTDPWDYPDRIVGCDPINHNFRQNGLKYVNLACFPVPGGATPNPHLRGNASRNVITGPGLADLDMSLFKNNYVKKFSEDFNLQFRAELFNVLNHTNFTPPNNNNQQLYNGSLGSLSTAGVLATPTATTSRQLQLAVKIIF